MTLQDGTKKMSKSAESDASRINLLDPPDVLYGKIKRAKTDGELFSDPFCASVHARPCTCMLPSAGCTHFAPVQMSRKQQHPSGMPNGSFQLPTSV